MSLPKVTWHTDHETLKSKWASEAASGHLHLTGVESDASVHEEILLVVELEEGVVGELGATILMNNQSGLGLQLADVDESLRSKLEQFSAGEVGVDGLVIVREQPAFESAVQAFQGDFQLKISLEDQPLPSLPLQQYSPDQLKSADPGSIHVSELLHSLMQEKASGVVLMQTSSKVGDTREVKMRMVNGIMVYSRKICALPDLGELIARHGLISLPYLKNYLKESRDAEQTLFEYLVSKEITDKEAMLSLVRQQIYNSYEGHCDADKALIKFIPFESLPAQGSYIELPKNDFLFQFLLACSLSSGLGDLAPYFDDRLDQRVTHGADEPIFKDINQQQSEFWDFFSDENKSLRWAIAQGPYRKLEAFRATWAWTALELLHYEDVESA